MGRIGKDDPDIGPVTKDSNAGFYCHPMLVIDPEQGIPLGFSAIKLWNRSWNKKSKKERKYALQAIEEKESYRWIESAKESLKNLPQGVKQTIELIEYADFQCPYCRQPLLQDQGYTKRTGG